jgi:hypothetical protein
LTRKADIFIALPQLEDQIQNILLEDREESLPLAATAEKTRHTTLTFPIHLVSKSQSAPWRNIPWKDFEAVVTTQIKQENAANHRKKLIVFREGAMTELFLSIKRMVGWEKSASLFSSASDINLDLITVTQYPTNHRSSVYMVRFLILAAAWARHLIEVRLKEDDYETIRRKLATSSIYYSYRHPTGDNILFQHYMKVFEITTQSVQQYETEGHTYYGSYLSEDSEDQESESSISAWSASDFEARIVRTLEPKLFYSKGHKKNTLKLNVGATPSTICPMHMRMPILPVLKEGGTRERFSTETRQTYERELQVINRRIASGLPIDSESLRKDGVTTQFYVAQYRGYHYNIATWNATRRREHRKSKNLSEPVYSVSITKTDIPEESALTLCEIFLAFKTPATWRYLNYTFTSLADLVQQAYTNDYVRFHQMIRVNQSFISNLLLNDANPFVSTGDIPYHALKYAYGIKAYIGSKDVVLKPRWNKNRKAERPYSGLVYVSLHPISDYAPSNCAEQPLPNHLTSLNYTGRVQISVIIAPERETSFPAYIPKERLVHQHVARYPSFEHKWRQYFKAKYGLSKTLYKQLSELLDKYSPHSKERNQAELLLAEWLCCYHGLRLVELARHTAEVKKLGILVYRDVEGNFVLEPPKETEPSKDATKKVQVKNSRELRKQGLGEGPCSIELSEQELKKLNMHPRYKFNPPQTTNERNVFWLLLSAVELNLYRALKHFLSHDWIRMMINYRYKSVHQADEHQSYLSNLDHVHIIHYCVLNERWESLTLILDIFKDHGNDLMCDATLKCDVISRNQKVLQLKDVSWLHLAVINLVYGQTSANWSQNIVSVLKNKRMLQSANKGATVIDESNEKKWANITPLHLMVLLQAEEEALKNYFHVKPDDVHREDDNKQTPLHYAAELHESVSEVIHEHSTTQPSNISDIDSINSDTDAVDGSNINVCDKCGIDIDNDAASVFPMNRCDCHLIFCNRCITTCDHCKACICDFCTHQCDLCFQRLAQTCLTDCDEKYCDHATCPNCCEQCSSCNDTFCDACFSMHSCMSESSSSDS